VGLLKILGLSVAGSDASLTVRALLFLELLLLVKLIVGYRNCIEGRKQNGWKKALDKGSDI